MTDTAKYDGGQDMKYEIKNRFTGEVQFTAEIDCQEDDNAAVETVATLRGADLRGADICGADLRGADLWGAIEELKEEKDE